MNVKQLIEELEKIEDKELEVKWRDRYGMGGDCCSTEEYHYHYDYAEAELEDVDEVCIEPILINKVNARGKILKAKHFKMIVIVG